jgi:hypothetical protein
MVPGKSDSYKKLEKRPANAGLFVIFWDGRGSSARFVLPPGLSRWTGKGMAGVDQQDDYLCL